MEPKISLWLPLPDQLQFPGLEDGVCVLQLMHSVLHPHHITYKWNFSSEAVSGAFSTGHLPHSRSFTMQ